MRSVIALALIPFFAGGAKAAVDQLEEKAGYTVGTAEGPRPPYPWPVTPETPGAAISEYSAFETYTFESGAGETAPGLISDLRRAGRDHSFSLDCLSIARR